MSRVVHPLGVEFADFGTLVPGALDFLYIADQLDMCSISAAIE